MIELEIHLLHNCSYELGIAKAIETRCHAPWKARPRLSGDLPKIPELSPIGMSLPT